METLDQIQNQRQYMLGIVNSIIYELENQKANLRKYQAIIEENWRGEEVRYISMSLNTAFSEINMALNIPNPS